MSKRIVGLDIGIASVGWSVIEDGKRIIDLGVRTFDKAETAKSGDSLNLARREARLARRRLSRRAQRMRQTAQLLTQSGLINDKCDLQTTTKTKKGNKSPWQLRTEGLDRLLEPDELARVIYHIVKHRGFHWISSAEKAAINSNNEDGAIKKGLAQTKHLMKEKKYRTVGELIWREFPEAQRNKAGNYEKVLPRTELDTELKTIFDVQRDLGNAFVTDYLISEIIGTGDQKSGLLWKQKPALQGDAILKMLGHCRFERDEYRAPKCSFAAERHVWLTRLNNLRVIVDSQARALTEKERSAVLNMPYEQKTDFTYKQFRNKLEKMGIWEKTPKESVSKWRFASIKYDEKDPESTVLCRIPGWQALKKAYENANMTDTWNQIANKALLDGHSDLLDQLAFILSIYKEDNEVKIKLYELLGDSNSRLIDALLTIRFDKFSALSLKAINAILPYMNDGDRYDEACSKAGYEHNLRSTEYFEKNRYLPPLFSGRDKQGTMIFNENLDVPRNPVVVRAINQSRKVLNAIVKKYGSPSEVHIELARDLAKSFSERNSISREQKKFSDNKEKFIRLFNEHFSAQPNGKNLEKFRLYNEQQCKCLYSGKSIDIGRLLEPGYVEIDHILPYSRSFDDSKNNKALVLTAENRDKGNRTPFEYIGTNSKRWHEFEEFVLSLKITMAKKSRLLRKDFDEKTQQEFIERNLNDTRYASRFFLNYVNACLQLENPENQASVVSVNGALTSFLRTRWGLLKNRSESDRHHALDAVVVACCTRAMNKRIAEYSKNKELEFAKKSYIDQKTGEILDIRALRKLENHFPVPWQNFRDELQLRLFCNDRNLMQEELRKFSNYTESEIRIVKPLFVSRAIQRRGTGALHKETIYSQKPKQKQAGMVSRKIKLQDLKKSHFNSLIDYKRNKKLYDTIQSKLVATDWDGKKAFPDGSMRMLNRHGEPKGAIVSSVHIMENKNGISIRGGLAENMLMRRVDVFRKSNKYYLVPVYFWQKELPNRAVSANKPEKEWILIDNQFEWCFSLVKNDLINIQLKDCNYLGYFVGLDRSTSAITVMIHDRSLTQSKNGEIRGIGVRNAINISKLAVDVLGNIYQIAQESRHELA